MLGEWVLMLVPWVLMLNYGIIKFNDDHSVPLVSHLKYIEANVRDRLKI